jgi:hypothetical protein
MQTFRYSGALLHRHASLVPRPLMPLIDRMTPRECVAEDESGVCYVLDGEVGDDPGPSVTAITVPGRTI